MAAKVTACAGCGATGRDARALGRAIDVHQCEDCDRTFCERCPASSAARECPDCGSDDFSLVGRVDST